MRVQLYFYCVFHPDGVRQVLALGRRAEAGTESGGYVIPADPMSW